MALFDSFGLSKFLFKKQNRKNCIRLPAFTELSIHDLIGEIELVGMNRSEF